MQRNIGIAALIISLWFSSAFSRAADYQGAAAVLKKISDAPPESATNRPASAAAQLKSDVESFSKQSASLKPEDAAQQWLKLLDRQLALSGTDEGFNYRSRSQSDAGDVWSALPPPADWNALRQAVDARPQPKGANAAGESALRLIVHTLVADHAAQTNDLAQLETQASKGGDDNSSLIYAVTQISRSLVEHSADPNAIMKSLETQLTSDEGSEFSVPNLVPLVGEEKTTAFLRRVLTNSTSELSISQGEETKKLARRLALELVDSLKAPQWQLACSLDSGPLFEALEKKFASSQSADNQTNGASAVDALAALNRRNRITDPHGVSFMQARVYYLLNLISKGRTQEAAALAQKLGSGESYFVPEEAFSEMERAGYGKPLCDFLYEVLSQHPELPFWQSYIPLAVQLGQTDKMLELARKSAARDDLTESQQNSIRGYLYSALLAADRVDEGVAEIRQILSQPPVTDRNRYSMQNSRADMALNIAKIGHLVGNTNWIDEGIRLTRQEMSTTQDSEDYSGSFSTATRLANFLVDIDRGPDAESLLVDTLLKKKAQLTQAQGQARGAYSYARSPYFRNTLATLVSVYYRAGRYVDVLTLVDQEPDWGIKDLAELHDTWIDNIHQHEDSLEDSVRHDIAASLLNLGRADEAKKIANAILDDNGGYDPAYEILVKAGGADVVPRLDDLFARDQFEERPLIWKAVVLQQNGKFEEAEAAARKAISIDPSDGEQGPGRRMRAYSVLSDIRKARGDEKEAETFRGIVNAIRLSEKADSYYQAGLLTQAIAMYEDSLSQFDGAYCIQSRLALRLTEAGKHEEAAEHYRRAYELMPDSFGRVESHCFGCEAAFSGIEAQRIANMVFTSLAKSDPRKPQVHYLLGYLREEQGNYAEALTHFRDAVKLDPDYLNAWKHINIVGKEYFLSAADQDAIAFNGIRLDPLNRHGGWTGFSQVTDLRRLWSAVETASRFQPKLTQTLYPLAESKAALEKQPTPYPAQSQVMEFWAEDESSPRHREPVQAILGNDIISAALQLFGKNGYGEFVE